mmetsp:Transcript_88052/g.174737  ORF Transcript_88052/g.174737 Transcript_88052/m.174737 type:complete len:220 (-) Transcript_88052:7-666(-)
MFVALTILSFVLRTVRPLLYAIAMLLIFNPTSFIRRTIGMVVNASAMCLVILPLTLVRVPICMKNLSFALSFPVDPSTFISSSIMPYLNAMAILHIAKPFAHVLSPGVQALTTSCLPVRDAASIAVNPVIKLSRGPAIAFATGQEHLYSSTHTTMWACTTAHATTADERTSSTQLYWQPETVRPIKWHGLTSRLVPRLQHRHFPSAWFPTSCHFLEQTT